MHYIRKLRRYEIVFLLTRLNSETHWVDSHYIPLTLLMRQVEAIGATLYTVRISRRPSKQEFTDRMQGAFQALREHQVSQITYGDLFLEDVRIQREQQLSRANLKPWFPLWGKDSRELANEIIELGFKAIVCSVDSVFLDKSFVGRPFDRDFLNDLPDDVDPCGENGEFHTFVTDGPIFNQPLDVTIGHTELTQDRFYRCIIT